MAERAHPDYPGFRNKWRFHFRRGFVPWLRVERRPYREALLWRYRWAAEYCKGRDVLDIPCGMGWGTSILKGCRSIIGVDICARAIREAQERYGRIARFYVGDMEKLEFATNSFDIVVCLEGVEHVSRDVGEAFLGEANRVMRPGGRLLLSSPYCKTGKHSGNEFHKHEYQPEEIKELVNAHFDIESMHVGEVDIMVVHYLRARKKTR